MIKDLQCPVCRLKLEVLTTEVNTKEFGDKIYFEYQCPNCYNYYTKKELGVEED